MQLQEIQRNLLVLFRCHGVAEMLVESCHLARSLPILQLGDMSAALLDLAPDGILSVDESGRISTVNSTAGRLLGRSCEDIEGRGLAELLRPSERGNGLGWLRDIEGHRGFVEVRSLRADGVQSALQLAVRAVEFDGRVIFACYLREARGRRRNDLEGVLVDRVEYYSGAPGQGRAQTSEIAEPIVYLIEADPSLLASLQEMLRPCGWVVESFGAASTFLAQTHPSVPSCAVLDVDLPDLDGLSLQARMGRDCASLPIIFVSRRGDVSTSVRAMKAGAVEFFTQPLSEFALQGAIRDAIALSASTLKDASRAHSLRARYWSLTPRERDVMRGVVAGLLNKQVASELGISEITVKAHRGRVMRKMNVRSLAELVNLAVVLGLPPSTAARYPAHPSDPQFH